jgi:glutathione reductase (NADPH)
MAQAYDLVVIGSGTAAQVASHRMASAGWKVAVIDHRPFGFTCALRGCDPQEDAGHRRRGPGRRFTN